MKTGIALLAFAGLCLGADQKVFISSGSAIYIDSNNGFDRFITAAFQANHVPLRIVSSPEKADFILDSAVLHVRESAATQSAATTANTSEAAVKLATKSGEVIWAYTVTKEVLSRGNQSVAEAIAKHVKTLVAK